MGWPRQTVCWRCCCRSPWWPGPWCFPWHSSPPPRWLLWFLHLLSPSPLSPWSSRTVPCPASPSINRPFCPNCVSSDKLICTELSVVGHGLILNSFRDDWLSNDIAHETIDAQSQAYHRWLKIMPVLLWYTDPNTQLSIASPFGLLAFKQRRQTEVECVLVWSVRSMGTLKTNGPSPFVE